MASTVPPSAPVLLRRNDITRADARQRKAAERVAAVEMALLERHEGAAIAGDIVGAALERGDYRAVEHGRIGGARGTVLRNFRLPPKPANCCEKAKVEPVVGLRHIVQIVIGIGEADLRTVQRSPRPAGHSAARRHRAAHFRSCTCSSAPQCCIRRSDKPRRRTAAVELLWNGRLVEVGLGLIKVEARRQRRGPGNRAR